jgi:hypothetical protein
MLKGQTLRLQLSVSYARAVESFRILGGGGDHCELSLHDLVANYADDRLQ